MEKIVITYGTFDLFHIGHLRLLRRLKDLGDKLIVGISSDEFNTIKGKKTIIPYEQRAEIVANIRFVDQVFPEHTWDQKVSDIKKFNATKFAMGDDWTGKFDELKTHCEVIYLPRTDGISSTQIKTSLNAVKIDRNELLRALDILEQLRQDLN